MWWAQTEYLTAADLTKSNKFYWFRLPGPRCWKRWAVSSRASCSFLRLPRSGDYDLLGGRGEKSLVRPSWPQHVSSLLDLTDAHRSTCSEFCLQTDECYFRCLYPSIVFFSFHSRAVRVPWNGQVLLQLPAGGRRDDLDHMTRMSEGVTPASCTNLTGFNQGPCQAQISAQCCRLSLSHFRSLVKFKATWYQGQSRLLKAMKWGH